MVDSEVKRLTVLHSRLLPVQLPIQPLAQLFPCRLARPHFSDLEEEMLREAIGRMAKFLEKARQRFGTAV